MFSKKVLSWTLVLCSQLAFSSNVEKANAFWNELLKLSENVKQDGDKDERKKMIKSLSSAVDFESLAKKSLGQHWAKAPKAKRDEFLSVLRDLVEKVLYPRAKRINSKVGEIKFSAIAGKPANVKAATKYEYEKQGDLVSRDIEIELIYSSTKPTAKIVDAILEGEQVSANLNRQFTQILEKKTLDEVIGKMRTKLTQTEARSGSAPVETPTASPAPGKKK
jgi:ABC-type transporter MlaC component